MNRVGIFIMAYEAVRTLIAEIPVPTHYGPESHQVGFGTGVRYGLGILGSLPEYRLYKARVLSGRSAWFNVEAHGV